MQYVSRPDKALGVTTMKFSLTALILTLLSVDRVFSHALLTVKRIPRTGSSRPPPDARLKLYGLYKQSTEGNVSGLLPRPAGDDPVQIAEREKWYSSPPYHLPIRTQPPSCKPTICQTAER